MSEGTGGTGADIGLLAARERVRYMLTAIFGMVEVDHDGDFTFPYDSERVFVSVRPFGADEHVVDITSWTNWSVPASPELFELVASRGDDFAFAHLSCRRRPAGTEDDDPDADEGEEAVVSVSHRLHARHLDPEVFEAALASVATAAGEIAEEVASAFGGERCQD